MNPVICQLTSRRTSDGSPIMVIRLLRPADLPASWRAGGLPGGLSRVQAPRAMATLPAAYQKNRVCERMSWISA